MINVYVLGFLLFYFAFGSLCCRLVRKSVPQDDKRILIQSFIIVFWLPIVFYAWKHCKK